MFGTRCSDKQGIATDMLQLMERFFEEHMLITIDALQLTTTQLPQSFEEAIQRTINVQQVRDRRPLPPPCRSHAASRVARVPLVTWVLRVPVERVTSAKAATDRRGPAVDGRRRSTKEDECHE